MRPVLLEMNGFAGFREFTAVDFTDADYFALVGPTGSGKSTVVDAMTFALYGSAPRWGRRNAISFALAPTTTRGTVRLVFDAGPHRYVVAREVRRTGATIGMKASRFERLTDPTGLGAPEELTESIASDSGVSDAVERLLGLTFEQFCQCVVLPQGDFAAFLQSQQAERQKILLKLLGAERYDEIARRANQRAALAEQRARDRGDRLADLVDATEVAEDQARAHQQQLETLMSHVQEQLPLLAAAAQSLAEVQAERDRLTVKHGALTAVAVPDGIDDLDAEYRDATTALDVATRATDDAQVLDTAARRAVDDGPRRGPLEVARNHHAEHAAKTAELPAAQQTQKESADAAVEAAVVVAGREVEVETARTARQTARETVDALRAQVQQITGDRDLLHGVTVPDNVADLADRLAAARAVRDEANAALSVAEERDTAAQNALGDAPDRAPMERARDLLLGLAERRAQLPGLVATHEQATRDALDAEAGEATAAEQVQSAQEALDQARHKDLAVSLRPHLVPGQPCPVCDQQVAALPALIDAPEVAAAESELASTRARLARLEKAHREARTRQSTAAAAVATAAAAIDGQVALADAPRDLETVNRTLAELDTLTGAARTARQTLLTARQLAGEATSRWDQLTAAEGTARAQLRATRDPLVALGAPTVDDADLLTAWTTLHAWAMREATARADELAAARSDLSAADEAFGQAKTQFARRERDLASARDASDAAIQKAGQARSHVENLNRRLEELSALLVDAPTDEAAAELLRQATQLEEEQREAGAALLAARTAQDAARRRVEAIDATVSTATAQLRKVRDTLVVHGAPDLPDLADGGLLAGWTVLVGWSRDQATQVAAMLATVADRLEASRSAHEQRGRDLSDEIARHGIDLGATTPVADAAPVVAAAVERARAATEQVKGRRSEAERLTTEKADAEAEQQVAKLLGDLLRADRFQRWLATTALDALVVDASASLFQLSGGQFDLTHDKGDFFVIDHADADSRRSVRTLSGGETFQASLALALALSAHMSTLATAAATRLDSIFLDEGFGTLDPDTLDVVASTLEGLAQGDRMVGVITHVAALAERVPVRYRVSRDAVTSSVQRETA